MKIQIANFAKEYKLPLIASTAFVIVVGTLLLTRSIDRLALSEVLGKNADELKNYGALLSEEVKKETGNEQVPRQEQPGEQNNPLTSSQDSPSSTPFTTNMSTPTAPSQTTDTSQTPTPAPAVPVPFSAILVSFEFVDKRKECATSSAGGSSCVIIYKTRAIINVSGGPGNLSLTWTGQINNDGQRYSNVQDYPVTDGTMNIYREWTTSCNLSPATIYRTVAITQSNSSVSQLLVINHNCNSTPIAN